MKGDLAGELDPHHHHASDPEEDDLPGGGQGVGGVEGLELRRLVGPPENGERPQGRAEPGVQDVLLGPQLAAAGAATLGRTLGHVRLLASVAVPDREPVAPPQLPGDAPGPDVAHPVEIDALVVVGDDADPVVLHHLDGGRRELIHAAEPLERDQRLDPLARAMGVGNRVDVGLLGPQPPLVPQGCDDRLAGLLDHQPGEPLPRRLAHAAVLPDHDDLVEGVGPADLEVVRVVTRRDLQRPGSELGIDMIVGDDLQTAADQRQDAVPADQVAVPVVVWVDGDRSVGQHRLGPDGGDGEDALGVVDRVVDLVERVLHLAVLHLEVRDRGPGTGVPVDDVVVAVDQALLVERREDAIDGSDVPLVEREALALVVAGGPQALVLLDDLRAVLLLPAPDALDERVATDVVSRDPLVAELALHHRLGGDARVVDPQRPERVPPAHPVQPDQGVLDRSVERVAHVERAGHVRRRDGDRVVLGRAPLGRRVKVAALQPALEDRPLYLRRLVAGRLGEALSALGVHGPRV